MAGVALGEVDFHFAWQVWHLATSTCIRGTFTLRSQLWWRAWFPFAAVVTVAVCVAGVALGDIDLHTAWQPWYLVTSTFTLRGRCGIYGTSLALVAFVTH